MTPQDEKDFNDFIDQVIARINEARKRTLEKGNICGCWLVKGFLENILEKL